MQHHRQVMESEISSWPMGRSVVQPGGLAASTLLQNLSLSIPENCVYLKRNSVNSFLRRATTMTTGKAGVLVVLAVIGLFVLIPVGGNGANIILSDVITANGNMMVNGAMSATLFTGNGSGLTGVEKRTPISACGITITLSGSYYVTQNLSITGGTCITVAANDVTIDLNGFTVTGGGPTSPYGIYINNVSNVEVRNGTIKNFSSGVYAYNEDIPTQTSSNRVINVRAMGNHNAGIQLDSQYNLIKECTVANNVGYGIAANYGSTITNNLAYANQNGIGSGIDCTITNNRVYDNLQNGIIAGGVNTVTHNAVYHNNSSGSVTNGGLYLTPNNIAKNNTLFANFPNNMYVSGSGNDIEENILIYSNNGIFFNSGGNFYANNRAGANSTANYNNNGYTNIDGGGNVGF
jgi:hypothetical protein